MPIIVGPQTGSGFVIRQFWAAVVVHDDTDESVPAVSPDGGRTWMPLIAADEKRLVWLRAEARTFAHAAGKPVKIVRFDTRTDLETIEP